MRKWTDEEERRLESDFLSNKYNLEELRRKYSRDRKTLERKLRKLELMK